MEDGLSQSVVLDIVQDSSGFLWIATQDGLNRYDGKDFEIFKYKPTDQTSIRGNWINSLSLSDDTTLWIGTYRNGLGKFNLKNYEFTPFLLDTTESAKKFAIGKIIPFNIFLFVATYGNGLYVVDLISQDVKQFKHNPNNSNSLAGNFIRSMILSENKFLWLGTTTGLDRFEIKSEKITPYFQNGSSNKLVEDFIVSLLQDSNNKLWIGTRKGLNIFDQTTDQLYEYNMSSDNANSLSDKTILELFEDSFGYVWIGTWKGGLNRTKIPISSSHFNYNKLEFSSYQQNDIEQFSLSGNNVRKIFEDRSKNLWIGTWGNSLNKLDLKPPHFFSVNSNKKRKIHINHSFVRSITKDISGRLWIGTAGGGLDIFDSIQNKFVNYSFSSDKNIGNDRIYTLYTAENNDVWVGLGDGLIIWRSKENKFENINIKRDIPEINNHILINSIVEFNKALILSSNNGLLCYDKIKNKFYRPWGLEEEETLLLEQEISFLEKGGSNFILVGTNKSFLFEVYFKLNDNGKLKVDSIRSYLDKIPDNYFASKRVNHILKDNDGLVWIATSQGLFRLDRNDSLKIFTEQDGLPNEIIYATLQDELGNIWISTNKGIAKISSLNGKFSIRNYDASDGLQGNEFNQASCYKSSDGTLYFGGINGYSFFNPQKLEDNMFLPKSVITNIKILNKEIPNIYKVLSSKKLVVDYSDKMLTFSFAALEFTNPLKNKYSYMLEGFDEIWINSQKQSDATYTNLNPGKYNLKIKTSNNDDIWSSENTALELTVNPPFYMTWWFILLSILTIIISIYLIYNYRVNRLLEIERLRIKIASDLHDEVGPFLTQISLNADSINYDSDFERIKKRSKLIRERSNKIRTSLSDVIWSIDARKDKFINLIDRMQDFGIELLDGNNIELNFCKDIINENKILKVDFRQNVYLIFKEAMNNAVKYADCSKIDVKLQYHKKEFLMKISDDGIGFNTMDESNGNGIKNMKMRAAKINAEFEILSKNGVTIILKTMHV